MLLLPVAIDSRAPEEFSLLQVVETKRGRLYSILIFPLVVIWWMSGQDAVHGEPLLHLCHRKGQSVARSEKGHVYRNVRG